MHIDHIALWTKDLEQLRAFYARYFDVQVGPKYTNSARQFESYFLSFANGARLEIMSRPGLAVGGSSAQDGFIGYAHVAISVGSHALVDALTSRLRADGITVIDGPRTTGDGYYESVVLDPDGNRIELTI